MKEEALKNFDLLIRGKIQQNDGNEGGYFNTLINNIGQNITVKIEDIEIIYLFHVSESEIVKLGLRVDKIELKPYTKFDFNNSKSKDIHIKKEFKISCMCIYFDVYDNLYLNKVWY